MIKYPSVERNWQWRNAKEIANNYCQGGHTCIPYNASLIAICTPCDYTKSRGRLIVPACILYGPIEWPHKFLQHLTGYIFPFSSTSKDSITYVPHNNISWMNKTNTSRNREEFSDVYSIGDLLDSFAHFWQLNINTSGANPSFCSLLNCFQQRIKFWVKCYCPKIPK